MKLIDKIQQADSNKLSDYSRIEYPTAKVIEKIADEYAVEFGEWLMCRAAGEEGLKLKDGILDKFKKEKNL